MALLGGRLTLRMAPDFLYLPKKAMTDTHRQTKQLLNPTCGMG